MNSEEHENRAWPQYLASASVCLSMVCAGSVFGWTSPTMSFLLSEDSPIPMSYSDLSWITSTLTVSVGAASIFSASTMDRIGRKPVILISAVCYIAGWICVLFANSLTLLYVYKIVAGFAIGASIGTILIYIGETVEPKRRGILGILSVLCYNFGVTFESVLGPRISFRMLNGCSMIFPILFLLTFLFMPESPHFLVSRGLQDQAYASLMWFRGQTQLKSIESEMDDIKIYVQSNSKLNFIQSIRAIFSKRNRNALVLITIVYFGQLLSGYLAITSFTERIFVLIDSTINPPDAVVLMNALAIIMVLLSMFIVDRFGRKILIVISMFGCSLSHVVIASYLLLSKNGSIGTESSWIAMVGLFSYITFYAIGISSVPKILLTEIFPNETKAWSNCLVILYESAMGFIVIKLFQIVEESVGAYLSFIVFAVSLFVSCMFILWLMPETKNKTFNEIQDILHDKKGNKI